MVAFLGFSIGSDLYGQVWTILSFCFLAKNCAMFSLALCELIIFIVGTHHFLFVNFVFPNLSLTEKLRNKVLLSEYFHYLSAFSKFWRLFLCVWCLFFISFSVADICTRLQTIVATSTISPEKWILQMCENNEAPQRPYSGLRAKLVKRDMILTSAWKRCFLLNVLNVPALHMSFWYCAF